MPRLRIEVRSDQLADGVLRFAPKRAPIYLRGRCSVPYFNIWSPYGAIHRDPSGEVERRWSRGRGGLTFGLLCLTPPPSGKLNSSSTRPSRASEPPPRDFFRQLAVNYRQLAQIAAIPRSSSACSIWPRTTKPRPKTK